MIVKIVLVVIVIILFVRILLLKSQIKTLNQFNKILDDTIDCIAIYLSESLGTDTVKNVVENALKMVNNRYNGSLTITMSTDMNNETIIYIQDGEDDE